MEYCKHTKQGSLLAGFHLNNQLTQSLTSRYRDSRLRVDFERFVCCAARLTCIFRECCSWRGGVWRGVPQGRCCLLTLASHTQATAANTWMAARGSSA